MHASYLIRNSIGLFMIFSVKFMIELSLASYILTYRLEMHRAYTGVHLNGQLDHQAPIRSDSFDIYNDITMFKFIVIFITVITYSFKALSFASSNFLIFFSLVYFLSHLLFHSSSVCFDSLILPLMVIILLLPPMLLLLMTTLIILLLIFLHLLLLLTLMVLLLLMLLPSPLILPRPIFLPPLIFLHFIILPVNLIHHLLIPLHLTLLLVPIILFCHLTVKNDHSLDVI